MKGTLGRWEVGSGADYIPLIIAYELGRFRDENRTVAIMKDNSIQSWEDAKLIVEAVKFFRENQ